MFLRVMLRFYSAYLHDFLLIKHNTGSVAFFKKALIVVLIDNTISQHFLTEYTLKESYNEPSTISVFSFFNRSFY